MYLDRAKKALAAIGITFPSTGTMPILPILEKSAKYDNTRITNIAATLQQSSTFSGVVRDQISGMDISARYAAITENFSSIRDDLQNMVGWMADGKLDWKEKTQLAWMRMRRGSIPDRFENIKGDYLEVAKSSGDQIARENTILEAYRDFRFALKQAEIDAQEVLVIATATLEQRKADLATASAAIESHDQQDKAGLTKLELARDEAMRALQDEDKSYQIVKDLADELKTSYNTAELVFARLQQTHAVKERLYQRMVSFFSTNEVVLSGMAASFTASGGLAEATNTMDSMTTEMGKSLESMATTGNQQLEAGLRAGYGSTLKSSSVRMLADAIVDFQKGNAELIAELRTEATQTANEIEAATESSKRRFVEIMNKAA